MTDYSQNLPFEVPIDLDVLIWRYIDFPKFISMLEEKSLWFTRVDRLGDSFEGSTPRAEVEYWKNHRNAYPNQKEIADRNECFLRDMAKLSRESTFVNCWHVNEHESVAMWQLYAKEKTSIAIQSTFKRKFQN